MSLRPYPRPISGAPNRLFLYERDRRSSSQENDHKALITQIITAAIGGVLLALQGVNISETNGNGDLIRRLEIGLTRQSELIQQVNLKVPRGSRAETRKK